MLSCINHNTASGARNYAILMLLLDTGLRCSEMRNMELPDVNIEGGYLKVMGKGGKERIVPFGASAQKALLRYLLHFRPQPFSLSIQNFFLTLDGKPLTKNSIKMLFQRIAQKSGVKRLHPHLCRHTFATNYPLTAEMSSLSADPGAHYIGDGKALCNLGFCSGYCPAQKILTHGQDKLD